MKGAGALTCFLAMILLTSIVHVINTYSSFQSTLILKMLYFTASRSKEAFDYCMQVSAAPSAAQSIPLAERQWRWICAVSTSEGIVITRIAVYICFNILTATYIKIFICLNCELLKIHK